MSTYAKIRASSLYRMGQIEGENVAFEEGEVKVLKLTDEVESYVDNAEALELLDTADAAEKLTDGDASQGEDTQREADTQGDEGHADSSDGDEDEQTYGERLRAVDGVGDSRAEQIEEAAGNEDELKELITSDDAESLPDKVVENLKAEFL